MGRNVEGVELTQEGMHAIFTRMGYPNIASGTIYNGVATIDAGRLNAQGFMPVLTGVGPARDSGHWIMLIKGPGNQYHIYDPLGQASGTSYQATLAGRLPGGSVLSVLPNDAGYNMGLCGYWVASVGLRARTELNRPLNPPTPIALGLAITNEMQAELGGDGYYRITGWLRAVENEFPGQPGTERDATELRRATQAQLVIPEPNLPSTKTTGTDLTSKGMSSTHLPTLPEWRGFSLYTDRTVHDAIQYAYTNHLGTRYTSKHPESNPGMLGGKTIFRQHHGLAHTVRTMAYAEVIVEEARKAKLRGENLTAFPDGRTLADVSPADLKKIMLAQAFFVAGRQGEESDAANYRKYHDLSKAAFLTYVDANKKTLIPHVFKDQDEVNHYASIVADEPGKDGKHAWNATPEHLLVNQGHMVDLLRVKQPPESYMVWFHQALQPYIGAKGADSVFAIQRKFFHATHEVVASFDPGNTEEHLVNGAGRFLVENNIALRGNDGNLVVVDSSYVKKAGQRFMTVKEYLSLPEVQKVFPGANKKLEGGLPGLSTYAYMSYINSKERAECETNVDYCLGQLQRAYQQARLEPIRETFQPSPTKLRREPTADELAAAGIIKQILANPNCIHDDHVDLNGKRLDTAFFRGLLAKCDMAIVGAQLNDTDMENIDGLMEHEKKTLFHTTEEPVTAQPIGEMWAKEYRQNGRTPIQYALVHMMQDGSWYYRRLNATAQGRDKDSTFKEVLLTTIMIPATNQALFDTQPLKKLSESGKPQPLKPPQRLFRGITLPEEFRTKLLNQSQTIIANNSIGLFADSSAQLYQQVQLNNFTHLLARTCLSTTAHHDASKVFGNIIFEMDDPDGLLDAKRVGVHQEGSEAEYSVYLPDDVALIPIHTTKGNSGEPDTIRLLAVKSPDFLPQYERGYALNSFMDVGNLRLAALRKAVETQLPILGQQLIDLRAEVGRQAALPIRDFLDRLGHRYSLESDNKISSDRKKFLNNIVIPLLAECDAALRENNLGRLERALATFPTEKQLSGFVSNDAVQLKADMDGLKNELIKKILIERQIIPALEQCRVALEKNNLPEAFAIMQKLPPDKEIDKLPALVAIREQLKTYRSELLLLHQKTSAPVIDLKKMRPRYDALLLVTTDQIAEFEKVKVTDFPSFDKAMLTVREFQQKIRLLQSEKIRMHTDADKKVDLSDITALEVRLQAAHASFYPPLAAIAQLEVVEFEKTNPKDFASFDKDSAKFNDIQKKLQFLREEKTRLHKDSSKPVDLSEINALDARIQVTRESFYKPLLEHTILTIKDLEEFEDSLDNLLADFKGATKALDIIQAERIKTHGASVDIADLVGLRTQLQAANKELIDALVPVIQKHLDEMINPATFHAEELRIQQALNELSILEKKLDDTPKATEQKRSIAGLKASLTEKQKAYPDMAQLQLKNEALIVKLRDLCLTHQTKNPKVESPDGIQDVEIDRLEQLSLKVKTQTMATVKGELINEKATVAEIISDLAKRKVADLQDTLGITQESAEELHGLLQRLNVKTADKPELTRQMVALDELSTKLKAAPLKPVIPPPVKVDVVENRLGL